VVGVGEPIVLTGTVRGTAVLQNVIRTGLYKPGFSPSFNAEEPAAGSPLGAIQFQLLGPEAGVVDGIPTVSGGLITGDYTQLYVYGGAVVDVVGKFEILTHDPEDPSVSYDPQAGDEFHLLVTGQFNSGIFGGIKDPAVLNYPDATGQSLFNFDEAPLPDGLEWAWQLRPDGLTLMVVPEPGTLLLLISGGLGLLAVWRRRRQ
jgi:hypothetical protein